MIGFSIFVVAGTHSHVGYIVIGMIVMMKIFHCISSIEKKSGGTSFYLQQLANHLAVSETIGILTFERSEKNSVVSLNDNIQLILIKQSSLKILQYIKVLRRLIKKKRCDLLHGNELWLLPVHFMASIAWEKKIPYIISPHGMLEPWALNMGKWKKRIALRLYQFKDLEKAVCLHATARKEAENFRKLGLLNPIAVIPNGIDLTKFQMISKKNTPTRNLLFLSRIHPKKGIEILIESWALIDPSLKKNWQVKIVGNGETKYIQSLKKYILTKNLEKEIFILGPAFGKDKIKAYQDADLFVLPTYSENFGIVVAEALASGIPVITTKGAPWQELNTLDAGWWIDIGVEPLVQALNQALQCTDEKRHQLGINGRKLVEDKYSIEQVAVQMTRLYDWILNKSSKPDFVYFDSIL